MDGWQSFFCRWVQCSTIVDDLKSRVNEKNTSIVGVRELPTLLIGQTFALYKKGAVARCRRQHFTQRA